MKGNRAKPEAAVHRVLHTSELVGRKEIAQRLGWSTSTVCNWSVRDETFPKPVAWLAMGAIYRWSDVHAWAQRTGRQAWE